MPDRLPVKDMIGPTAKPRASSAVIAATALVLLLLTSVGTAQAFAPDGTVRGYVTEAGSAVPVPGAFVRITASDLPWTFETTADGSGYFQLSIPPHRYLLYARGLAHLENTVGFALGSAGTTWANITLSPTTPRNARFQGYVTDSVSGSPVTVGRVAVGPPSYMTGYANASALNASGYYGIDVIPMTYELWTEDVLGYAPYQTSVGWIGTGQVLWLNFTLDPNPVDGWLNGTVRDADTSAPVVGATVGARVDGLALSPVATDGNGDYSIPVPSGNVEVYADAPGYAPVQSTAYVSGGGGTSYLDLYLPPLAYAVRGYVRDGLTGAPIAGARVTVTPFWSDGYYDERTTDSTGYFGIDLPQDDFSISARAPGYTTWSGYILYWSASVLWANATLWPIVSTITGFLIDGSDGSRIPGLMINAIDARAAFSDTATSDPNGSFTLTMTPSPAITVWVYGQGIYAGAVAYVRTLAYVTTWLNITVDRISAQIRATVTDAQTGLPIAGATVAASWTYGSRLATTDASGMAVVDAPPGIALYVSAGHASYMTWSDTRTLAPGSNPIGIALYPDLTADVWIRGYVNDSVSGSPLWNVDVEVSGYGDLTVSDRTDSSGYYELWTVPRPQTVRAADAGYAAAEASVNPSPGETVWVNLTLGPDTVAPRILSFTATPSTGVSETNPAALLARVNESSLDLDFLSILMLHSAAGNVGTFLLLDRYAPSEVSVTQTSPGNYDISASWDTRSPVARLSDGVASAWWPLILAYGPFQGIAPGYWDNATIGSPISGTAVFDVRDGRLLYVVTALGYIDPRDQPTSTFAPYAAGARLDLTTAAILGGILVTAPTFQLGSLSANVASAAPSGQYAALVEVYDAARNYDARAVLMSTMADIVPPVANAGPDATVDEDTVVTFDGTASTDNVGIILYTWTFVDGTPQVLTGPIAAHTFASPGVYLVTLTVEDGDGNTDTDSFTVTVRDVTDPIVSVTSPAEGASVSGSFAVTVSASDNVGVVRVEFRFDGAFAGDDTAAPFEWTFSASGLGVGNHTFTVVAYDAAGNFASAVRRVSVPPGSGGGGGGGGPSDASGLLVPALLAVLAAVGIVVALIFVRRRRPRSPAGTPSQAPRGSPPETSGERSTDGEDLR